MKKIDSKGNKDVTKWNVNVWEVSLTYLPNPLYHAGKKKKKKKKASSAPMTNVLTPNVYLKLSMSSFLNKHIAYSYSR